jgi:hypothetical protein
MTKWAWRPHDSRRPGSASPDHLQSKPFPEKDLGKIHTHQSSWPKLAGQKQAVTGSSARILALAMYSSAQVLSGRPGPLSFGSGPRRPSDLAGNHPARSSWQRPRTRGWPSFPRQMHPANSSPWARSNAPLQGVSRTATPSGMDVIPTDRHPPISPSNRHRGFSGVTTSA